MAMSSVEVVFIFFKYLILTIAWKAFRAQLVYGRKKMNEVKSGLANN